MVLKYVPNNMRVRVAVAGGTGGLGRAIVNGLLGEHHEVFVLTRKVICHFLDPFPHLATIAPGDTVLGHGF